jgi:hypothetical protein
MPITPPMSNTYRLAGGNSLTRLKKFSMLLFEIAALDQLTVTRV